MKNVQSVEVKSRQSFQLDIGTSNLSSIQKSLNEIVHFYVLFQNIHGVLVTGVGKERRFYFGIVSGPGPLNPNNRFY